MFVYVGICIRHMYIVHICLHVHTCLHIYLYILGFPGGSVVKNLPAMQETQVRSLVQEDPLEKEMAPHSSVLAWRIPWTEEPGGLQSTGSHRVRHDLGPKQQKHKHTCVCMIPSFILYCVGILSLMKTKMIALGFLSMQIESRRRLQGRLC